MWTPPKPLDVDGNASKAAGTSALPYASTPQALDSTPRSVAACGDGGQGVELDPYNDGYDDDFHPMEVVVAVAGSAFEGVECAFGSATMNSSQPSSAWPLTLTCGSRGTLSTIP